MADALSLFGLIVDLIRTIDKTASLVNRRKVECLELCQRADRLAPLVQKLQTNPELVVDVSIHASLDKLVQLLQSTNEFLEQFTSTHKPTVWKRIWRVGTSLWNAEDNVESFLYLNRALDSIMLEINTFETSWISATLQRQSQDAGDRLETFYVEEPPMNGPYDNRSVLGIPGMFSTTHRMRNTLNNHTYAVKRVRVAALEDIGVLRPALLEECNKLQRLTHANIARYFVHFDSHRHRFFNIVMELIEGGSLADKVNCEPAPSEAKILEWGRQMASAVAYMHDEGVIHRDLNPKNVMLNDKARVKIIGFGAARNLSSLAAGGAVSSFVGSENYASYEKREGLPYDGRDDVWAAGCILLELVTRTRLNRPICNPECPYRDELLTAAGATFPALGSGILPRVLVPLQEGRYTAKQLELALGGVLIAPPIPPPSPTPTIERPTGATTPVDSVVDTVVDSVVDSPLPDTAGTADSAVDNALATPAGGADLTAATDSAVPDTAMDTGGNTPIAGQAAMDTDAP